MIGSSLRLVTSFVLIVGLFFAGWILAYPSSSDPKNIRYVLWKVNLWKMDLPGATVAMIGDTGRNKLILGKTKQQLENRFGSLQRLDQVSPYYREGYEKYWNGRDVLFVKDSPWMIVFERDRAKDLVLMKGY